MLNFRRANEDDMLLYFEWANDEEVRKNAINKSQIFLVDHKKWFSKKITSDDTMMLLCLHEGKPVGQLRIDIEKDSRQAIIDYSVDKASRGKGFGTVILKEGLKYFLSCTGNYTLTGVVNEKNTASVGAFIKAGYKQDPEPVFINGEKYLKFIGDA